MSRWLRAVASVYLQAVKEKEHLPYRQAVGYVNLIRENIISQKYAAAYPAYSERYYEWKYHVVGSIGGFWFLKGHLVDSLTPFKAEEGWMGGVPPGILVEGSSWFGKGREGRPAYVGQYARWMEYGSARQPERPLFQPTFVEFRTGGALQEAIQSLNNVASRWH